VVPRTQMHKLFFLLSVLIVSLLALSNRTVPIGPGFWNVRASLIISGLDIGTHMSFIQLKSGRFIIVDTVELDNTLIGDINELTKNGALVDAVIATHPFHTLYFPVFYKQFPKFKYYGTPRHLRIQPDIPWAGNMYDCASREIWLPEVHMRIPRGAEFQSPQESNHFSGIHVFHAASRTIHVDDTIMIDGPFRGDMLFHPSLVYKGLYHIPESPKAFKNFVQSIIDQWDFDNICAAHDGVKKSGAKSQLQSLLSWTEPVFQLLAFDYGLSPNATDAALFKVMQDHEAKCKE